MSFQESSKYPLVRPQSPNDPAIYYGLDIGAVRLGPMDRTFLVSMFHQLHCLQMVNFRFKTGKPHPLISPHHIQHCLRMLLHQFMCEGDLTLEDYDFMEVNFTSVEERVHKARTCRDWQNLHSLVENNFIDWRRRKTGNRVSHIYPKYILLLHLINLRHTHSTGFQLIEYVLVEQKLCSNYYSLLHM
jgi:hypothetical protein